MRILCQYAKAHRIIYNSSIRGDILGTASVRRSNNALPHHEVCSSIMYRLSFFSVVFAGVVTSENESPSRFIVSSREIASLFNDCSLSNAAHKAACLTMLAEVKSVLRTTAKSSLVSMEQLGTSVARPVCSSTRTLVSSGSCGIIASGGCVKYCGRVENVCRGPSRCESGFCNPAPCKNPPCPPFIIPRLI